MRVTYFARDNGACAYYRMVLPLETLAARNGTSVIRVEKGDNSTHIEQALDTDIIVVPRTGEDEFIKLLPTLKRAGKKIIIDHDDNMFKISPFNPVYEENGTEEVYINVKGELIPMWISHKRKLEFINHKPAPTFIDIEKNIKRVDNFKRTMEMADMVTTTTDILADVYRKYNENVKVLPNCIDINEWKKLPLKHDEIRLYWSGGSSHYEDWCILMDVLPEIMEKYKNVKLVLLGMKFDATLKKVPQDKIEFHRWVGTAAYPFKTAILNPDICLIPLQDNEFNRCKSNIKWVEMSAMGVPCVTSYVSPYKEWATEENGVFIENNDRDAWIKGISYLIENPDKREEIGQTAKRTVKTNFDINNEWSRWQKAYKELLQ